MSDTPRVDNQPHPRVQKAVLVLLIAIMCGLFFLYYRQRTSAPKSDPTTVPYNQNMSKANGRMRIVFDNNQSVFTVGEPIAFSIYADTHGQKVVGFDIVMPLSAQQVKMLSVESLQTGMTVHSDQTADKLSLSGVMSLEDATQTSRAFANEPIVRVVLKPFVTTSVPLAISYTPDETSDSNLVLEDAQDILGGVDGAVAYIGTEHVLNLNQTKKITDTVSMTLQPAVTPGPNCADCMTTIPVLVSSGGVSTVQSFAFGGIAGVAHVSHEIEGGIVEATLESSPTTLRIRFAKL